jgi:hypothetical protein
VYMHLLACTCHHTIAGVGTKHLRVMVMVRVRVKAKVKVRCWLTTRPHSMHYQLLGQMSMKKATLV